MGKVPKALAKYQFKKGGGRKGAAAKAAPKKAAKGK